MHKLITVLLLIIILLVLGPTNDFLCLFGGGVILTVFLLGNDIRVIKGNGGKYISNNASIESKVTNEALMDIYSLIVHRKFSTEKMKKILHKQENFLPAENCIQETTKFRSQPVQAKSITYDAKPMGRKVTYPGYNYICFEQNNNDARYKFNAGIKGITTDTYVAVLKEQYKSKGLNHNSVVYHILYIFNKSIELFTEKFNEINGVHFDGIFEVLYKGGNVINYYNSHLINILIQSINKVGVDYTGGTKEIAMKKLKLMENEANDVKVGDWDYALYQMKGKPFGVKNSKFKEYYEQIRTVLLLAISMMENSIAHHIKLDNPKAYVERLYKQFSNDFYGLAETYTTSHPKVVERPTFLKCNALGFDFDNKGKITANKKAHKSSYLVNPRGYETHISDLYEIKSFLEALKVEKLYSSRFLDQLVDIPDNTDLFTIFIDRLKFNKMNVLYAFDLARFKVYHEVHVHFPEKKMFYSGQTEKYDQINASVELIDLSFPTHVEITEHTSELYSSDVVSNNVFRMFNYDHSKIVDSVEVRDVYSDETRFKELPTINFLNPKYLCVDLSRIIFLDNSFAWDDKKYGKRIKRYIYLSICILIQDNTPLKDIIGDLKLVVDSYNTMRKEGGVKVNATPDRLIDFLKNNRRKMRDHGEPGYNIVFNKGRMNPVNYLICNLYKYCINILSILEKDMVFNDLEKKYKAKFFDITLRNYDNFKVTSNIRQRNESIKTSYSVHLEAYLDTVTEIISDYLVILEAIYQGGNISGLKYIKKWGTPQFDVRPLKK